MADFRIPPADLLAGLIEQCRKAGADAADARIGETDGVGVSVRDGKLESIETSDIHLEVVRALKEINSLLATVAYPILRQSGDLLDSRLAGSARRPEKAGQAIGKLAEKNL